MGGSIGGSAGARFGWPMGGGGGRVTGDTGGRAGGLVAGDANDIPSGPLPPGAFKGFDGPIFSFSSSCLRFKREIISSTTHPLIRGTPVGTYRSPLVL